MDYLWFFNYIPTSYFSDFISGATNLKTQHAAFRVYNNDEGGFVQYEIQLCLQEELAEKIEQSRLSTESMGVEVEITNLRTVLPEERASQKEWYVGEKVIWLKKTTVRRGLHLKSDTQMQDWRYFKRFNGDYNHLENKARTSFETMFTGLGSYSLFFNNCQHFSKELAFYAKKPEGELGFFARAFPSLI